MTTDNNNVIPYMGADKTFDGVEVTMPGSVGLVRGRLQNAGGDAYDKLKTIFAGQNILMDKYHAIETCNLSFPVESYDCGDIDSRLVQARLHELFGFLVRELGEAMQELRSKPWKQGWRQTDRDKFEEEMADSLHFFVEMCITAGISAEHLFDLYFKAWEKNRDRQSNGYTDTRSLAQQVVDSLQGPQGAEDVG
jgi:NTP pyrophosphatase (non-canonical NTP hydrolase)